jgi:hypothetical protein
MFIDTKKTQFGKWMASKLRTGFWMTIWKSEEKNSHTVFCHSQTGSEIRTTKHLGGFHNAIYALRMKFTLCAPSFSLILHHVFAPYAQLLITFLPRFGCPLRFTPNFYEIHRWTIARFSRGNYVALWYRPHKKSTFKFLCLLSVRLTTKGNCTLWFFLPSLHSFVSFMLTIKEF